MGVGAFPAESIFRGGGRGILRRWCLYVGRSFCGRRLFRGRLLFSGRFLRGDLCSFAFKRFAFGHGFGGSRYAIQHDCLFFRRRPQAALRAFGGWLWSQRADLRSEHPTGLLRRIRWDTDFLWGVSGRRACGFARSAVAISFCCVLGAGLRVGRACLLPLGQGRDQAELDPTVGLPALFGFIGFDRLFLAVSNR